MDEAKRLGEYNSVGGSATHVLFNFPGHGALYMGSLISVSYSTFRDKTPVYNLGNTNIDGFAMGKRYIAGSIIKTFFMNDDLKQFLTKIKNDIGINTKIDNLYQLTGNSYTTYHNLLIDDIVPFDIIIVLCSEYGDWSISEVIYGATFINTGQVYSIADIMTETTMSFIANDVKMTHDKIGSQISNLPSSTQAMRASNIQGNTDKTTIMPSEDYSELTYQELLELVESGRAPRSALSEWQNKHKQTDYNFSNTSTVNNSSTSDPYKSPGIYPNALSTLDSDKLTSVNIHNGVDNIHDGDTISFIIGGKKESIRLIGLDTPEVYSNDSGKGTLTQPYGLEAREAAIAYIKSGKWDEDAKSGIIKDVGVDTYGRKLVVNPNFIDYMIRSGFSYLELNDSSLSGMTEAQATKIRQSYEEAKRDGIGIHGSTNPIVTPEVWRNSYTLEQQEDYLERIGADYGRKTKLGN